MELKSNKKRYSYLDLLKCIAMYGVVFYHGAIPWVACADRYTNVICELFYYGNFVDVSACVFLC